MEKKTTYSDLMRKLNTGPKDSADRVDPVYHFIGDEDFLKDESWRKIVSMLVPDELKSFNLDLMYGNETSADQLVNAVFTYIKIFCLGMVDDNCGCRLLRH